MGETAHRFGQRPERAPAGVRAGLAKAGDPQHDQTRVERVEPLRAQPPPLQHTGPEVLDEHLGIACKGTEDLLALGGTEVERHASVVAGDDLPPQAVTILVRSVRSRRITPRVLHLDDVGAEIAEQHGGDRRGIHRADIEDTDTPKRTRHSVLRVWMVVQ
jgi:hypothetical protein